MVACNYFNKLLIHKLPARRGSVDISAAPAPKLSQQVHEEHAQAEAMAKENERPADESDGQARVCATNIQAKPIDNPMALARRPPTSRRRTRLQEANKLAAGLHSNSPAPALLYVSAVGTLVLSLVVLLDVASCPANAGQLAAGLLAGRDNSRSPPLAYSPQLFLLPPNDWRRLTAHLRRQFSRVRPWRVGGGPGPSSEATRFPAQQVDPLRRAVNRVRQHIGARNSIRVHNAFRDFAWRVLSSLSMPTPVIYELRRQNYYPPDEDTANDQFYNRNTTRSVRTRRHTVASRRADDDDDDEPSSFRDRLRLRLEDMVALSRRTLFGRVVRLPSLIPFLKRLEDDDDDGRRSAGKSGAAPATARLRLAGLLGRRKKRRQVDRQMISINGKQYYVGDDGELKEWREDEDE